MTPDSLNLFHITADQPFLQTLAQGVLERCNHNQMELARWRIYLPNQRACKKLKEIFTALSPNKATLLPQIGPLSALQPTTLPNAKPISPHQRTLMLSLLVKKLMPEKTESSQLFETTKKLCDLLDQAHAHYVDWTKLHEIVPEQLAQHWQASANFIDILHTHWPNILDSEGLADPEQYRSACVDALINEWQDNGPRTPTIIAGSTASIPSTAKLMADLMRHPNGYVILPLLDHGHMDGDLSLTHPHYNLAHFLDATSSGRHVHPWLAGDHTNHEARVRSRVFLDSFTMAPAQTNNPLKNIEFIEAQTQQHEARCIALKIRENLEIPEHTTILVTPDRQLAEKVKMELKRWDISVDDTADQKLTHTVAGQFMQHLLTLSTHEFDAPALLAFLHNPLCTIGTREQTTHFAKFMDQHWLRTPDSPKTLDGLLEKAERYENTETTQWITLLIENLRPLQRIGHSDFHTALKAHLSAAESLCKDLIDQPGGQAILAFSEALSELSKDIVSGQIPYPDIFSYLLSVQPYRTEGSYHPRVQILGLLEARLQTADTMILGGLNEGVWPPESSPCPWLSEAMREQLGLPLEMRRVGLSAHDFGQLLSNPQVLLTRSVNVNNAPTVPARWIPQMEIVLQKSGFHLPKNTKLPDMAQQLAETTDLAPIDAPSPTPSLASRPKKLSVTDITTWKRNPYEFYARKILDLKPLDPLETKPDNRLFGTTVHNIIETLLKYKDTISAETFMDVAQNKLAPYADNPIVKHFWMPKLHRVAHWLCETLQDRKQSARAIYSELPGELKIANHTITAKADYIEERQDGLIIADFKTGTTPSATLVNSGHAPQLAIEGLILSQGGFKISGPIKALEYWQIKGGDKNKISNVIRKGFEELQQSTLDGLTSLVVHFNDPATSYRAVYDETMFNNPYHHLSRQDEWIQHVHAEEQREAA